MTPQESKMLEELMARVDGTRLEEKDPEATQVVEQWTARNRDAAYILAQTVLVQNYALEQAKTQIQALQQQAQQHPAKATSFLGGLFGHKDQPETARSVPPAQQAYPQPSQGYVPVPQYAQQPAQAGGYPPPPYGAPQQYAPVGGGGSSFLRSAATTAAGVAAGALAFEGVESLMHGFGHAAGYGGTGSGLGDFGGRPEETVINNYYDSPEAGRDGGLGGQGGLDTANFAHNDQNLSTQQDQAGDVNVDGGDQQLTGDTDLPTLDTDSGSYDDASLDDSSFDDGGSDDDFSNS